MTTTTAHPVDTQLIGIIHDALRRDLGRTFDTLSIRAPLGARPPRRTRRPPDLDPGLPRTPLHHRRGVPVAARPPRAPTSAPMLHQLTTGHARIHHATGTVTTAVRVYRNSDTPRVRDDLRGALERLCTILLPQLDREETELTPILATTIHRHRMEHLAPAPPTPHHSPGRARPGKPTGSTTHSTPNAARSPRASSTHIIDPSPTT
ncbi:hypothetical protein ACFSUH_43870 [Rhodococcus jostii]|uniref:hypothetical protein n=1 Tax=Rhodococcus jostii TaxID=132919 RepID=UPI0036271CED